jgi:hypothetical protein
MTPFSFVAFALVVAASYSLDDAKSGTSVTLGGLTSTAPADWKQAEAKPPRIYQFSVPKAEGDPRDADIIIFHFGQSGGGTAVANVARWKAMFVPPEGKTIDDVAKVDQFKVGAVDVTAVDIQGTYKFKERPFDPDAPVEMRPATRLIGIIFPTAQGTYYVRFIGPAKTIAAHKQDFDGWLKSFK